MLPPSPKTRRQKRSALSSNVKQRLKNGRRSGKQKGLGKSKVPLMRKVLQQILQGRLQPSTHQSPLSPRPPPTLLPLPRPLPPQPHLSRTLPRVMEPLLKRGSLASLTTRLLRRRLRRPLRSFSHWGVISIYLGSPSLPLSRLLLLATKRLTLATSLLPASAKVCHLVLELDLKDMLLTISSQPSRPSPHPTPLAGVSA